MPNLTNNETKKTGCMDAFGKGCINQGPCRPHAPAENHFRPIGQVVNHPVRAGNNPFDNDEQGIWLTWVSLDGHKNGLRRHDWDRETGEVFEVGLIRKIHAGHYREALTRLAKAHNLTRPQIRLIAKKLEASRNFKKSFTEAVLQYTNIQLEEIQAVITPI